VTGVCKPSPILRSTGPSAPADAPGARAPQPPSGLAHVGTASFLASRAAPSAGFWIALAGGAALARAGARRGVREGYGASLAAMVETVAIMGPARFGVPLTQAISAPVLGRLEARGANPLAQIAVCAAIRFIHNTAATAFFIWVITGGLEAYAGTYDALAGRVGIDLAGAGGALVLTGAGLLGWAAFASTVQVLVYRRALRTWPEEARTEVAPEPASRARARAPRFDPRAIAVAAGVAFTLLLLSTDWMVLSVGAAWLAGAWALSRPDRSAVPTGLALAVVLASGAFVFTFAAGLGLDLALRRAARAALLVLVATWLRAAAGHDGLREVSRRALRRLRRLPSVPEAARVLDDLGAEGRLAHAGRSLLDSLRDVRKRPLPIVDAVLGWVAAESGRFARPPSAAALPLALRPRDLLLVALAGAPLTPLLAG
jgi:hypothetical protein